MDIHQSQNIKSDSYFKEMLRDMIKTCQFAMSKQSKHIYKSCLATFFLTFLMEEYKFGSTIKRTKANAQLLQDFDNQIIQKEFVKKKSNVIFLRLPPNSVLQPLKIKSFIFCDRFCIYCIEESSKETNYSLFGWLENFCDRFCIHCMEKSIKDQISMLQQENYFPVAFLFFPSI